MNALNSLVVEGTLVRDAEVSDVKPMLSFSIEVKRYFRDSSGKIETETNVFDVEAWGEFVSLKNILKAGRTVRIVGRLKQNRWTDSDGKAHSAVVIIAENIDVPDVIKEKEMRF